MQSNWLYDRSALWISVILVAGMLLGFEVAYRAGRRWQADTKEAGRDVFVAIKVSILGLLALLLAFAFGMAAERYAYRQRLVTDEANVLHRVMLYGSLLPEPERAQYRSLLRQFVDARLAFFYALQNLAGVEEAINRTEKLHGDLWEIVRKEVARDSQSPRLAGMIQSLNDEWSLHRQRVHAFEDRVPEGVTVLLFGGSIVAMTAVGFAGGIGSHRTAVGKYLLAVLIGGTIFVILDLDRSRRGIFKISQEPIVHFQELLNRDDYHAP